MNNNPYPFDGYAQPGYARPMSGQYNPNQPYPYSGPFPPPPVQPNPYNPPYPPPPANINNNSNSIVIMRQNYSDELGCPFCGRQTQTIPIRRAGGVTYMWCCCLFMFTLGFCWLPFCIDTCQDVHLVCVSCRSSKQVIHANCC